MTLSSINAVSTIDQIGAPGSVQSRPTSRIDASGNCTSSRVGSADVSQTAQLLSQLQQLQQSDPTKFKNVAQDIANQLGAAAQQVGGAQGQALSSLSTDFQQAAQTGSLPSVQATHPHHHAHHRAAGAYQQASGQTSQGASSGTDLLSQLDSILSQAIGQDLDGTASGTVA